MRNFITLFLLVALSSCAPKSIRVAFIAGMDPVSESEIYRPMFRDGLHTRTYSTAESFELFKPENDDTYDVLVFYDIELTEIPAEVKANIVRAIGEKGKPAFIFHDGLLTYNTWEEFGRIAGMKYFMSEQTMDGRVFPTSRYKHNQPIPVAVADPRHFITRGMPLRFEFTDEIYDGLWVAPDVHPLWTTTHPECEKTILYTHRYGKAKVLGVVPGHGPKLFEDPRFRQAFRRGIEWLAK